MTGGYRLQVPWATIAHPGDADFNWHVATRNPQPATRNLQPATRDLTCNLLPPCQNGTGTCFVRNESVDPLPTQRADHCVGFVFAASKSDYRLSWWAR
jgi:hypothetical protein